METVYLRDILFELQKMNARLDEIEKKPVVFNIQYRDGGLAPIDVIEKIRNEIAKEMWRGPRCE